MTTLEKMLALAAAELGALGVNFDIDPGGDFPQWRMLSRLVAAVADRRCARVIAVSGSQGSGKSTLAGILAAALGDIGRTAAVSSIDDFYLTRAEREALAADVHPLLRTRGVPGTHDWRWLGMTLDAAQAGASELTVPRFDKGADDRVDTVSVSADVFIVEGWCLGVGLDEEADAPCNDLEAREDPDGVWRRWVDQQIAAHYLPLWQRVDLWVQLRVPGFAQVVDWRTRQEQQLPADQRMSKAQIQRFVQHYERLTRRMWRMPPRSPGLVVELDQNHSVAGVTALLEG